MPRRKIQFIDNQFYHIFNRSVGDTPLFIDKVFQSRMLSIIDYYRFSVTTSYSGFLLLNPDIQNTTFKKHREETPLIEILSFALMPNHYHFLIKQLKKNGIRIFIANIQNSFAKYFNIKNKRHGTLFCNSFKSILIPNEFSFFHVSRYIHLNPVTSNVININDLVEYELTSFSAYMRKTNCNFLSTQMLDAHFSSINVHKRFVFDQSDYQKNLNKLKKLIIE